MQLERLKKQLLNDEGLRLEMYKCQVGKNTIGVGHNLDDRPISKRASMVILEDDINETYEELTNSLYAKFNIKLNLLSDVRIEVLMNMAFQMGVPRLMKFKNTFHYIKHEAWDLASTEMLDSFWFRQMHEFDMLDGTDSVNRAERLSYAMRENKFMKGVS